MIIQLYIIYIYIDVIHNFNSIDINYIDFKNMDKKKPQRVNFRINHCSSQDKDYPASQLLLQSPNAKGWQSSRFCQYPQTIVYQLVEPTIVKQISILSHQSKIATKVIIHNRLDANKQWHKLGFLSLQSNVTSNYQARQLKTVNLHDKPSLQIRFSFEANYVNKHNVFNQVGVISLCVFGDRMLGQGEIQRPMKTGSKWDDTDLDKNTKNRINQLNIQKQMAIDEEDFDKAQTIKKQIERLIGLSQTLKALNQKKQKAVENQDYQNAKIINNKIKQLRDAAGGGPNFTARPSGTPSDYYRRKPQQAHQQSEQQKPSISPMTFEKKQVQVQRNRPPPRRSPPKKFEDQDRPINVKNTNPYQNFDEGQFQAENDEPGRVQPLTGQIKAQCAPYFPIFDEQIFAHLFSAHHANRDRGLNLAKDQLMRGSHNKNQAAQAFLYVVKSMLSDKNVAVLLSVIDLFSIGMKKIKPPPGNPFSQLCEQILQKLNDYLGHTNQKVRKATQDIYLSLPTFPVTNKDVCYKILTLLGKRQKPPKISTGRLKTLDSIVGNFQLGKNYQSVINYAIKYADDKNNQVRTTAINLICTIANEIGYASIQPFMKNLRPQIIKTIEQKFHDGGGQDNRDYDQRPIPTKNNRKAQSIPIKHAKEEFEAAENQFIQVPPPKNVSNPQYQCEFCQRFDKRFENQDYRDLHLFNACPMLTLCQQCSQTVQISTFTAHKVGQCSSSKYFKKCPRCKQAVHQRNYKSHVEKKECIPAKPPAVANRCPLCHLDIDPGKDGWKAHLVDQGCENNPRK